MNLLLQPVEAWKPATEGIEHTYLPSNTLERTEPRPRETLQCDSPDRPPPFTLSLHYLPRYHHEPYEISRPFRHPRLYTIYTSNNTSEQTREPNLIPDGTGKETSY